MKSRTRMFALTSSLSAMLVLAPVAHAATTANSQLTQSITAGVLSTSILNGSGAVVASPSFAMSSVITSSSSVQTSTGTFGSSSQRITVDNPGASSTGWTLALSGTGSWSDGGTHSYPFNAASSSAGQLTINAAPGTLTALTGTTTGISKGTSGTFASGSVDSIEVLNAASGSDDVWNGYLTGVSLSQTVPAATPVADYSLTLTQTVAAQ